MVNQYLFPWQNKPTITVNKPVGPVLKGEAYLNGNKVNVDAGTANTSKPTNNYSGNGYSQPASNPYADYMAQMQANYERQQARAEELARQKQQAAQDAYNKNMGYLSSAYDKRGELHKNSYQSALEQLQAGYDSGARGVNANADNAQQQAYINAMMAQRDMPQALAAQGITGGASESTLADMRNSYGNSRNQIDTGRNESLTTLLDALNSNKASALQSYNTQLSNDDAQRMAYQMELEQALANGTAEILNSKYDSIGQLDNTYSQQMAALQQKQAEAAAKAASKQYGATNKAYGANTTQGDITKTPLYKRAYDLFVNQGSPDDVYKDLKLAGADDTIIDMIFAKLGI